MNLFSSFAKRYKILLMLTSLELELNPVEVIFLEQSSQSEQQVQLDVFFYSIFVFVSPVEVFVQNSQAVSICVPR